LTGKHRSAFRTIGELSAELGIKPHILRYWEEQFPMLMPLKRSGARRYYRPEDVNLVQQINDLLNHQGYTIKGARQYLAQRAAAVDDMPSEPGAPAADTDPLRDALYHLRDRLHAMAGLLD
jgi:DNA-binding transcriptional MerR regulator